jgi:hypothetical protein
MTLRSRISRVRGWVVIVSFVIFLLGLLCLWIASRIQGEGFWPPFFLDLAAILVVAALIQVVWEFYGKTVFLEETLREYSVSQELHRAGITKYTNDFDKCIDWDNALTETKHFDAFFSYAHHWRGSHNIALNALMKREKVEIQIVLPDLTNPDVVRTLSLRYIDEVTGDPMAEEEVVRRIQEALDFYYTRKQQNTSPDANIKIYLSPQPLLYSYYRFDEFSIATFFKHEPGIGGVPTFIFDNEGSMGEFFSSDFKTIVDLSEEYVVRTEN